MWNEIVPDIFNWVRVYCYDLRHFSEIYETRIPTSLTVVFISKWTVIIIIIIIEYTTYPLRFTTMWQPKRKWFLPGVEVEYTLKDGRINEEAELFFPSSLLKLIHNWYCNWGLTTEHVNLNLPSPAELESANQCAETLGPKENFFDDLPFHMDV